ncbi:sulfite exporter TauE/SafE family protein [Nonomuraea sp. NPDC050394]|uniref:urease accessory protein UreH domain-containing protein n=1 Tax=Nonomuraea sp. NPDC050394 TaxID=3364363 RepID=UPI00378E2CAB
MGPGALFVSGLAAGLVAGTASCTAVQGGLLVGLTGGGCREDCGHGKARPWLVAQFLTGRLAAYVLAGALLGWLGSAVQLPPRARAGLLVAAGIIVIAFAVRLIRRRAACAPHRTPRRAAAPVMGAATILLPCGVTLGIEMVAVSTGSALSGAAVMAGFVLGTSPAFALLGYILRRLSRTRLAAFAGAAAIAVGLWTIGSGVSLGGWLPASPAPALAMTARGEQKVDIWAMRDGYRPAMVEARAGVPVEVTFHLAGQGCTRTVTLAGRDHTLPATVRLPPQPPGTLRYVCSMGMYTGFIRFS